jgi:cellulose synthase/poly-beta-1,6-N-acetylglucosamine synthase-like glycosyltransferase
VIGLIILLALLPLWLIDSVFLAETLLGLVPLGRRARPRAPRKIVILTPAHNEQGTIGASVAAIGLHLPKDARHLVIAHNCGDDTAQEARAAGADVAALNDPDRRGKGYALAFGRDQLAADPPDIVIVIDADCTVDPGTIERLADAAAAHGSGVQASYLFRSRSGDAPMVQISNFAMLVKNVVRQRGGSRLGAPALMTGSGMAFPWDRFAALNLATGNIVEDLAIGLELIAAGAPPAFEEGARIWSVPSNVAGTETQRARWEGGFMATARSTAIPLLARGLTRLRWSEIWMGLHLTVPPLTLLLAINAVVWIATGLVALLGASAPFILSSALLAAMLGSILMVWLVAGRQMLEPRMLIRLPFYVFWKLALFARLVRRKEEQAWVRTERID